MGKIIGVINQKGGVGKTTTAVNLAAFLAKAGRKVLLIDTDSQGNATSGLSMERHRFVVDIYDVMMGETAVTEAIYPTSSKRLFLLPASMNLAGAEIEMVAMEEREYILKNIFDKIQSDFDYLIIDCPPALGLMTLNVLSAADSIIIPIQAEFYALEGLSQLVKTIRSVTKNLNPDLDILGILLTMFDGRTNLSLQVQQEVKDYFGDIVFKTVIPRSVKLSEAPGFGQPITTYAPKSKGGTAYKKLCREVLKRVKNKRLGRGLEALLGETSGLSGTEELKITDIVPNAYQPRREFDPELLQELADSIRIHGVVQPIIVRRKNRKYELIAGERRLRAASLVGLTVIPAIVREYTDKQSAEIALIENLQRENLTSIEEGQAYDRLMKEYGYTQEQMAQTIGKSRSYIANTVRLLALPEEVQELILVHKVTGGQVRPLLSLTSVAEQIQLARKIEKECLSARQVEEIIRQRKEEKKNIRTKDEGHSWIRELEEKLHTSLGTPVTISFGKGKNATRGKISVSFKNNEEFERLMKKLAKD